MKARGGFKFKRGPRYIFPRGNLKVKVKAGAPKVTMLAVLQAMPLFVGLKKWSNVIVETLAINAFLEEGTSKQSS